MKVVTLQQIIGTDRQVDCPHGGFVSYRYLLERDGLGFSMHQTFIPKGNAQHWHYRHHLEACYCISGHGLLTFRPTGETWEIWPHTVYALDKHDDHSFQALEDTVLVSVFNPPVTGREVHDLDGSYKVSDKEFENDLLRFASLQRASRSAR